ncbi:hypothetical protein Aph01nite_77280 [Acrocarpospora phusangensis]|uniref:Carrier domain-containing protein n=1 Tax=Acrocarpospora phusangensis TaxID=1070424 RepID=A0A919UT68_9ACTN|nr:condensation domain-containing protein [Acrocarpospora phusangensis]GIH29418.1 hypothetical protein Aph01nite_77280 [Acrocarpospora phusangensis]
MSSSLIWEQASPAQHGMWVTDRLGGDPRAHHMPLLIRLTGELDQDALASACAAVVARHPLLAKALSDQDGVVGLTPALTPPSLEQGPADVTFDLSTGPLVRFILTSAGTDHELLIVAHHAIFDGMSKDLLVRDLSHAYTGTPLPPPSPAPETSSALPQADFSGTASASPFADASGTLAEAASGIAREPADHAEDIAEAADFWRPRWRDPVQLALPGLTALSLRATPADAVDLKLDPELGHLAESLGLTRFEALVALLHTLLYGYRPGPQTVAVDLSTRTPADQDTIGLYANELPVFTDPAPADTFAQFARTVRAELRDIYRHRRVPIARALTGITPRAALAPVSLSYRRRSTPDPGFPGLTSSVEWMTPNGAIRNTLHIQVVDGAGARLSYDPACLTRASADLIATDLTTLLAALSATPYKRLRDLPPTHPATLIDLTTPHPGTPNTPAAPADNEILAIMTTIWCEVLGVEEVHPDDDLFDLGGHSLTITQIIARVDKRLGVELTLDTFFETPTLAELVSQVAAARPTP